MAFTSEQEAVKAVLEKDAPLTRTDLQVLRSNSAAASNFSSRSDWFVFRMEVEFIDAIAALNNTSTRLAKIGIGVGIVGVLVTIATLVSAFMARR